MPCVCVCMSGDYFMCALAAGASVRAIVTSVTRMRAPTVTARITPSHPGVKAIRRTNRRSAICSR